jgi:uncharacterized protein with ATP-grasp and redox domains
MNRPNASLPIPEPLRGAETGSFAHDTVVRRLPAMARRALAENDLTAEQAAAVEALAADIPAEPIRRLADTSAPDAVLWAGYVAPRLGQSWLDVPWFFAETYFFRRVLEATGYFGEGPGRGMDPYALQKRAGLELAEALHGTEVAGVPSAMIDADLSPALRLVSLLREALWGNQADLSLWPAEQGGRPLGDAEPRADRLLADDTPALAEHILGLGSRRGRVDVVLDNGGLELLADLALVDVLLVLDITVVLHAKPHPTYVSDVTEADLAATLAWLRERADAGARAVGERLTEALGAGRLVVRADWFWTSPLAGWEMPPELREELGRSGLLISKGDANYRRWLGDRHWPYDAPLGSALAYAPAPLALLRTCKSEVAAGLAPERMAAASAEDAGWLTNGRWGVIQFHR